MCVKPVSLFRNEHHSGHCYNYRGNIFLLPGQTMKKKIDGIPGAEIIRYSKKKAPHTTIQCRNNLILFE
jgi:hypothetical protein